MSLRIRGIFIGPISPSTLKIRKIKALNLTLVTGDPALLPENWRKSEKMKITPLKQAAESLKKRDLGDISLIPELKMVSLAWR